MKRNYFDTLNQALQSENILHTWEISQSPISYGETRRYNYNDRHVSIYRDERGMYERPIHYKLI